MSDNNEEKIFLSDPNGLQISNKRIVVESKTYALNLVTSVDINARSDGKRLLFGKNAFYFLGVVALLVVCSLILLCILYAFGVLQREQAEAGFPIAFLIAVISLFMVLFKRPELQYWVEITTASGTEQVLCCDDDEDYAIEIVEAINQAIVSK